MSMKEILQIETPLKKVTDGELISGLQKCKNDKDLKHYEFEFYRRFAPHIYKAGSSKCRNFRDGDAMAREILQLTFISAFKAICKFSFPPSAKPESYKKLINAWLGKIANRLFLKEIEKRVSENTDYDTSKIPETSFDSLAILTEGDSIEVQSKLLLKLQEAMSDLSEQDKHIVLTYAGEDCINSTKKLSKNALKQLTDLYQTTSEAIRQRKKRALDHIKKKCFE